MPEDLSCRRGRRLACVILILGICGGCQSFDPAEELQSLMWHVEKLMRKPGETLVGHPDAVWKEFDCAHQQLPFVAIDLNEIRPTTIAAGNEFGHRLIYSLCPQRAGDAVVGDLYRRVVFKGNTVFEDVSRQQELKPGKWRIDAFISIPKEAQAGVYSVEVTFASGSMQFERNANLVVTKPLAVTKP